MGKKIIVLLIGILLIGSNLYAGDLIVNGKVTALKSFQGGTGAIQEAWTKVTFPTAFDATPVLVASGIKVVPTSFNFFVQVRNITATDFEYRAINYDGSVHNCTDDYITWLAFIP